MTNQNINNYFSILKYIFLTILFFFGLFLLFNSPKAHAATFTVTNTTDNGAGSLRQAITDANNTSGADTINFSVGTGSITITVASELPTITESVVINGLSQPGATTLPIVNINGNNLPNTDGFEIKFLK